MTFMLEAHLDRLQTSANGIALELPYSLEQIADAIATLVRVYPDDSGYLRLVVTRGVGSLGIDPRKCARPSLFIIADELVRDGCERTLPRGVIPARCRDAAHAGAVSRIPKVKEPELSQ